MANNTEIKAKAKTVSNDSTLKQSKELEASKLAKKQAEEEAIKARKETEEAKAKAKEAKAKAKEAKEEAEKKTKEKDEIMNLATKALNSKKSKGFIPGIIIGIVLGFLLSSVIGFNPLSTVETAKDSADALIDETFFGYTAADFKDAIIKKAISKQELIVMEQPLEIETTITKAGLGGLEIFSKTKSVTYSGTGEFTVNLSKIDEDHIEVDEENKTVTVYIPHAVLHTTVINYDEMKFEDTEKGLLAFGDIHLSVEEQNELEKSVKTEMETRLNKEDILNNADEFAIMNTWQIFQPLVSAVSPEFTVEVEFNK